MVKSPSKYLSRKFLFDLMENRFISPSGVEYCEPEVIDLFVDKETRLRAKEFDKNLRDLARMPVDHEAVIRDHQDLIFLLLKARDAV